MRDKRRLFILGAGSFGRELESWLGQGGANDDDWRLAGFLHSPPDSDVLARFPTALGIVGDWRGFRFSQEDYVLLGVTDPSWKTRLWNDLHGRVTFFTYVSPYAIIGNFNAIGTGSVLAPNCTVTTNVSLGEGVTLNIGAGLGHDTHVGEFSSIMGRSSITGGVSIGPRSFVGAGAVLIPGISVGSDATIGAGSVVLRNVSEGTTVFGNPAKVIWP